MKPFAAIVVALVCFAPILRLNSAVHETNEWFRPGQVHSISLSLDDAALTSLRRAPREYVSGTVQEGATLYTNVAIHLKGSIGSFRSVDSKPALTLSFGHFASNRLFHGTSKIHLNNSVEDGSYLNELLGTECFRAAGIPAPAATHAIVELNGRRLGVYVLKEGFTPQFLARNFGRPIGRLYEPTANAHEVGEPLECKLDGGDHTRKPALVEAASALRQSPAARWAALQSSLDRDEFLRFMALEVLLGHHDGYCVAKNNFRIYDDPARNRLVFLPHGMDQLFGRMPDPIEPAVSGRVALALLDSPEGAKAFRQSIATLFSNLFASDLLEERIQQWSKPVEAVLVASERETFQREIQDLRARVAARRRQISDALATGPVRLQFTGGIAVISNWQPVDATPGVTLDRLAQAAGEALHIRAQENSGASWRTIVKLSPGRYRFEGRTRTEGVVPRTYGRTHGAALLSGKAASKRLLGTMPWTDLSAEFELTAASEVELRCELRSSRGEAWFDASTLKLRMLP